MQDPNEHKIYFVGYKKDQLTGRNTEVYIDPAKMSHLDLYEYIKLKEIEIKILNIRRANKPESFYNLIGMSTIEELNAIREKIYKIARKYVNI